MYSNLRETYGDLTNNKSKYLKKELLELNKKYDNIKKVTKKYNITKEHYEYILISLNNIFMELYLDSYSNHLLKNHPKINILLFEKKNVKFSEFFLNFF